MNDVEAMANALIEAPCQHAEAAAAMLRHLHAALLDSGELRQSGQDFRSSLNAAYNGCLERCERLIAERDAAIADRNAARKPWMIELPGRIAVAVEAIVSAEIESRHYANGSTARLVITLSNGVVHRIDHTPHCYDGIDIYKLHKEICDA